MRSWRVAILVVLVSGIVLPVAANQTQDRIIIPGESVGGVRLGSDFSSFEKAFPKHPDIDTDYPDNGCGIRAYQWVDLERNAAGVFAYIKEGKILQLSVQTPRFSLVNGIGLDATEEQVKQAFPKGRAYVLVGSGMAVVGGRNLIYWVDKNAGIAFELYWNSKKNHRLVGSIDVFEKAEEYRPEGCISPPREWRELKQSRS